MSDRPEMGRELPAEAVFQAVFDVKLVQQNSLENVQIGLIENQTFPIGSFGNLA